MQTKTAIIFGATGAIGRHLVATISSQNPSWNVLAVTRSETSSKFDNMSNVKVVQGDPNDPQQAIALSKDADLVYCCVGLTK